MLKNRGRDPRSAVPSTPLTVRALTSRAPMAKPEPDYEVVEFPTDQYVNAKIQPPPPPPPRPATGHPIDAGASCGLCGGGGARVRCTECGRRALCASCDDMYHRHPKRRHHQRQALSHSQLLDERPPLPPKAAPPVPPPRRHKISGERSSASPRPPVMDQRRATLNPSVGAHNPISTITNPNHFTTQRAHIQQPQGAVSNMAHMGSMPYLPSAIHHANAPVASQEQTMALGQFSSWGRPRGSLPGFNMTPNMMQHPPLEPWEVQENLTAQNWGRPLRRGASVMELGGGPTSCTGCAHCAANPWRYGSCANLDHQWIGTSPAPGAGPWPQTCCSSHSATHNPRMPPQPHTHALQTPQPHRRMESRGVSRAASRAGSRAASPALSVRSRTSRRSRHRTPSPPIPSSDADSETEMESNHPETPDKDEESSLGPPPPPPAATWQCEHCTFVNEPGVRVCAVCCRTPTIKPKIVTAVIKNGVERLQVTEKPSPSPSSHSSYSVERVIIKNDDKGKKIKARTSTGCGPSPPRELSKSTNMLNTPPTRAQSNERMEQARIRHDIAVGPSPPKEVLDQQRTSSSKNSTTTQSSNRTSNNLRSTSRIDSPIDGSSNLHNISVGPSPPRDSPKQVMSSYQSNSINFQKKSVGNSPPRENVDSRPVSRSSRTNTGTSPPPQSISTQTYEVPNNWERAQSVARSRPRRRLREDSRRERSHSRLSLSSDTRESERSVHTSGGRWEWREPRDSSPSGDWSESERRRSSRLTRRASHLDVRRRPGQRSMYGSEAPSPEPLSSNRAISLEALAGAGSRSDAERGLELARLMTDAERLGFSAAEVHAALAQNPVAPLAWLSERWPSLCAGVRAAAARLAPGVNVTELEARASLAKHRGAMWPAVNDCVERSRRQIEAIGQEGKLRGHVWGPPTGADDEGAPPSAFSSRLHRTRADDSSDEFEVTSNKFQDDDWMYLPLETNTTTNHEFESPIIKEHTNVTNDNSSLDIAEKLKSLLIEAGIPLANEKLLLKGLLGDHTIYSDNSDKNSKTIQQEKSNVTDFIQSENDFIAAYNALTKLSPLPNKNDLIESNDHLEQNETQKIQENFVNLSANVSRDHNLINDPTPPPHLTPIELQSKIISKDQNTSSKLNKVNEVNKHSENNTTTLETISKFEESIPDTSMNNVKDVNEDKQINLNEIVDNTQKLIQQMKKEINADINSINEKSNTQSEDGDSTNDSHSSSEKESSYSDLDAEDTEDLTSDEKDTSTSDDENPHFEDQVSIHRTSSEDNEHFEEAMDHVENELEDFKQTNIEILNSIARSLQEEHTITIEINESKDNNYIPHNQDMNNNLFAAVNSFEEIYAELNNVRQQTESNTISNYTDLDPSKHYSNKNSKAEIKTKLNPAFTQEYINLSYFRPDSPIRLVITEQVAQLFTASIENFDSLKENDNSSQQQDINDKVNETLEERAKEVLESHVDNEHFELRVENSVTIDENFEFLNENMSTDDILLTTDANSLSNNTIEKDFDEINSFVQENQEIVNNSLVEHEEIATINPLDLSTSNAQLYKENTEKNTLSGSVKTKSHTIPNKSNIPKLVKTIQSAKQKMDNKNLPKLIASKVPIRRASLKQYPAPNPPKGHFGNIQSGQVKQLQSKLFNNKVIKTNIETVALPEVRASTSTMPKKSPAPPPPNPTAVQPQHPNTALPKNKNLFFRETCRTEDEWTESDQEDQDFRINLNVEESNPTPVSQIQPVTLRQISGQLIDLANIRLSEGSPERQARMLLAEGATETWEQAQLAVDLISQGTDPPAALMAALECADLSSALAYLHQDCELCASKFPEHEMVSMLRCTHRCCRECARHYFTVQITERSIVDCVCPYCKDPELENLPEDDWLDYFAHMDILLKTLLEIEVHELFQRKLRDRTLAKDPNFKWCVECSSGFFVHPKQKKLRCPECKSITCSNCRKKWTVNHDGITCEQYAAWLEDNDPERSIAAVQQHLRENGLECPRCHFKYSLSRGGCMHFTCTQCKYEFCYGCGKPFTMGARCGLSEYCARLGLHAHHPRNCLFYLRDKEPHELQTLLQMNNVTFETETAEVSNNRCPIQLQRETPTGLVDTTCGSEVQPKQAGLCKMHYVEYLAGMARTLDPIPIMDVSELVAELRRRALPLPERGPWDTDPIYAGMCAEIVREKIPLE